MSDKEELHTDIIRNAVCAYAAMCPVIFAARTWVHNTVVTHRKWKKNIETLVKLVFALLFVVICIFIVHFVFNTVKKKKKHKGRSDYEIYSCVGLWESKTRLQ